MFGWGLSFGSLAAMAYLAWRLARVPWLAREGARWQVWTTCADLHLGATLGPRWLEARIAEVEALKPDLVVLLGDVFEGHGAPAPETVHMLRRLQAPLGVWGVNGNHERHGTALSPLESAGVQVLQDAWAEPAPGLLLAGSTQAHGHGRDVTGTAWAPPLERLRGGLVLLSHVPSHAQEAAQAGVGLMLSGHTHGGQIWPFGYLVGTASPVVQGQTSLDRMTLIVNRGAGTWGPRMRLWKRAEISLITLRARPEPPSRTPA